MFGFLKDKLNKIKSSFTKEVEKEIERKEEKTEERPAVIAPKEEKPASKEKKSFTEKIAEKITKTTISEDKFEELFFSMEVALLENNVAVEVINKIKADLKTELVEKPLPRSRVSEVIESRLKKSIEDLFSVESFDVIKKIGGKNEKPFVILFVGINGSGKTTTIAKLASLLKEKKMSCVIAAADTFRAAAIQQLEKHADKLNIRLIKHAYGSDPAAVAFDAISHAGANHLDVVLIDTAGRMHSNVNLMDEIKKIVRVAKPDLKIFVGESITGNDCVEQAKRFNEAVGMDAIILTKADVDEKGGTAISISYVTKKPIIYMGTGQNYSDLKPFDASIIVESLGLAG